MAFLVGKVLPRATWGGISFLTYPASSWVRVASVGRMLCCGSAPSQMSLVGSPEWEKMIKNIERSRCQPPHFEAQIKATQRTYDEMHKRMEHFMLPFEDYKKDLLSVNPSMKEEEITALYEKHRASQYRSYLKSLYTDNNPGTIL